MQNVLNVAASHYVEGKLKATLQLFKKIQNTKAIFNPDLFSAIIFCRWMARQLFDAIGNLWSMTKISQNLKKKFISNNFFGAPKLRNSEKEQVGAPTVPSAVIWVPTEFDDFCVIGHQMCHMRPFSNRFQKSLEHGMCILKSTQKQNYPSIPKVVPALDKHAHSKKGVQRIFDRDLF
jgi:hypothetical protein